MLARNNTTVGVADTTAAEAPKFELDFESDEPLPVCPMRQDGSSSDVSAKRANDSGGEGR